MLLILIASGINNFLSHQLEIRALFSPIILILAVIIILQSNRKILSVSFARIFYWPFISFLVIGALVSISIGEIDKVFDAYRYYLPSLIIYWAGIIGFYNLLITSKNFISVLIIFRWVLFINVAVILFTFITGSDFFIVSEEGERRAGFLLNANEAGFSACLLLAIEIYLLRIKASPLSRFLIPAVLIVILLGFSKAAIIMTVCIFILNILLKTKSGKRDNFKVLGYIILLLLLSIYVFREPVNDLLEIQSERGEELVDLFEGEVNPITTSARSTLATYGFAKIMEKPYFGHGIDTFMLLEELGGGVHNQYLLIWGDAGIFALLAFIVYLIVLWRHSGKLNQSVKVVLLSFIVCIALYSATNHNMYGNKTFMLVLAFITVIIIRFKNVRYIRDVRA